MCWSDPLGLLPPRWLAGVRASLGSILPPQHQPTKLIMLLRRRRHRRLLVSTPLCQQAAILSIFSPFLGFSSQVKHVRSSLLSPGCLYELSSLHMGKKKKMFTFLRFSWPQQLLREMLEDHWRLWHHISSSQFQTESGGNLQSQV